MKFQTTDGKKLTLVIEIDNPCFTGGRPGQEYIVPVPTMRVGSKVEIKGFIPYSYGEVEGTLLEVHDRPWNDPGTPEQNS